MTRLIKLSFSMFKNVISSKQNRIGVAVSFVYSILWIAVIHPQKFQVINYTGEYFRLLYILMIFLAFQLIEVDIKNNIHINLFTGIFTRGQIIISKLISLLYLGIYFSIIGEVNNVLVCLLSKNCFGFSHLGEFNHLKFILTIILITFTMGSLSMMIMSLSLKQKILSTVGTIALGFINFNMAFLVTQVEYYGMEINSVIKIIMNTPFYITTKYLIQFEISNVVVYIAWGTIFFILLALRMGRKEIS